MSYPDQDPSNATERPQRPREVSSRHFWEARYRRRSHAVDPTPGSCEHLRIRLCGVEEIASGEARRFDFVGHRIALVRVFDAFYAIGDCCTHENVSLADGQLVDIDELEIECPKHGSRFSLVSGDVLSLPALRPEPVYAVEWDDSDVFVTLEADV